MTTVLTDVNTYLVSADGKTKSFFGRAKELQIPDVEIQKAETNSIGAISTVKLPVGVKLDTCNLLMNGFEKDAYRTVANPFKEFTIMVYGNLREFNGQEQIDERQVKAIVRGSSAKFSQLGKMTQQENVEMNIDIDPSYVRVEEDNTTLSEIDISNHIWVVDGKDLLAQAVKNMGL